MNKCAIKNNVPMRATRDGKCDVCGSESMLGMNGKAACSGKKYAMAITAVEDYKFNLREDLIKYTQENATMVVPEILITDYPMVAHKRYDCSNIPADFIKALYDKVLDLYPTCFRTQTYVRELYLARLEYIESKGLTKKVRAWAARNREAV